MSVSATHNSTVTLQRRCATKAERIGALRSLGPDGRLAAFERRELSFEDCCLWAALFPHEPPTINGEYVWIAGTTPEVCE